MGNDWRERRIGLIYRIMNSPKISVIVPVYKAEAYLHRCVDSLLAQTFQDFEVLLVDDGSPDRSGEICDEYARQDSRVRVFHKENGGVSSARNLGLDNARGEWISFVDADDWVSNDFLYVDGSSADFDVIEKSYKVVQGVSGKHRSYNFRDKVLCNQHDIFYFFINKRNNALWNKLISSQLILNVRFDENVSIGEDFLFFLHIISKIKNYLFSSKGEYNYYVHEHSAMNAVSNNYKQRISILWYNMEFVNRLISGRNLYYLRCGIVYGTYLPSLMNFYDYLSDKERAILKNLIMKIQLSDLKLMNLKSKISLLKMKLKVFIV